MFIISKRSFKVRRADGTFYRIKKDYVGDIPQDVFESRLVQKAVTGGLICAPETTRDKDLHKAQDAADEKEQAADIRPDAKEKIETPEQEEPEETKEPVQEGTKIGRAKSRK